MGATKLLTAAGGGITLDAASTATDKTITIPADTGTMALTSQLNGFRNRIINGAMMIDQRNAGAASANTINGYFLDRWQVLQGTTGKLIAQQNAGSLTGANVPTGLPYYLGVTSQSAYSAGSSDYYLINQYIEGLNTSDLGWGTATASAVTLSFWVRSSLTGTFGVSLCNSNSSAVYVATYTVNSASTWEQKTITIAGPTTGTWQINNSIGIQVRFCIGAGSTYQGSSGSWGVSNILTTSAQTSVVGTSGATFYITGVQLEKGSVATGFDYRPYGTELALCQRYFERSYDVGTATGTVDEITADWGVSSSDTSLFLTGNKFKVTKRSAPTMLFYNTATGASGSFVSGSTTMTVASYSGGTASCARLYATAGIGSAGVYTRWHWTASSEL